MQNTTSRTTPAGDVSKLVRVFEKNADDVLDYTIDWSAALPKAETVATSTWQVEAEGEETPALIVDSTSFTDESTTIWLSGGTPGVAYYLTNTITTEGVEHIRLRRPSDGPQEIVGRGTGVFSHTYVRSLKILVPGSQAQ